MTANDEGLMHAKRPLPGQFATYLHSSSSGGMKSAKPYCSNDILNKYQNFVIPQSECKKHSYFVIRIYIFQIFIIFLPSENAALSALAVDQPYFPDVTLIFLILLME